MHVVEVRVARTQKIRHHPAVGRFAERLRAVRRDLGMSQQDLAEKATVNIGYIGKLERGEAAPGLDMVARLADALGVPLERLLSDAGRPAKPPDAVKEQVRRQFEKLLSRDDVPAMQSLSVVIGLMDNALARRNS